MLSSEIKQNFREKNQIQLRPCFDVSISEVYLLESINLLQWRQETT